MSAWDLFCEGIAEAEVVGPSGAVDRGRLPERAAAIADGLRDAGVRPGNAVAVVLGQDVEFVTSLLGAWAADAVPVPVDVRLPAAEVTRVLERAGAAFAIAAADPGIAWGSPSDDGLRVRARASGGVERPAGEALLLVTSGTSGLPKLASVPVRALRAVHARFPLGSDQVFLAALPLAHAFGLLVALLAPLARGARVIVTEWTAPRDVVAFGTAHRASVMPAVPRMVTQLLRADLEDLGTIRAVVVGGAAAAPEDLIALQERYGVLVGYGYGMTETAAMTTLNLHLDEKRGSVGRPFPGVEIRIAGSDGAALPAGSAGEIWLRDGAVAAGYAGGGELPVTAGWLRTGDLGWLDDEGYLYLSGRVKDVIITSGYNVAPDEVEQVLEAHPAVQEAAVLGVPHPERGEEVVAVVVPAPGGALDTDALRAHARAQLAGYKVPRRFHLVRRELPRTATGKVLRWKLRESLLSAREDEREEVPFASEDTRDRR